MLYRPPERIFTPAASTVAILTLDDLRAQVRVGFTAEDDILGYFIAAATGNVEMLTQRLLTSRACTLRLPALPSDLTAVELPGGVVTALASIVVDGVTVAPANYEFYGDSPARVAPLVAWPVAVGNGLPVTISYNAGYATPPGALKMAALVIAAEMFERRSAGSDVQLFDAPVNAEYLMAQYRIIAVG